jgi:hypothetical protein
MSAPPLTLRTIFPPEINPSSAQLALRRVWSFPSVLPSTSDPPASSLDWENKLNGIIIPKPHGTVTEVSKGGYSLSKALGWNHSQYREIQVHSFGFPCGAHLSFYCQKYIECLAKEHLDTRVSFKNQGKRDVLEVCDKVYYEFIGIWKITHSASVRFRSHRNTIS